MPEVELEDDERVKVDGIISRYEGEKETLIPILQDITTEFNWLPPGTLARVSEAKQIPMEHILRIATFYKAFSLKPRGKHIITVCVGTACHVKGAQRILDRLERELGIKTGETTSDMQFTLEAVRCLGCCGLAPVVTVGEELFGQVNPAKAAAIVGKYQE
ncbi:MAG: NADH-quinone oxidoreductase subunit NuoE [Phycisphaerae bacterium]|nr:NADH-quinone oxidoreductase subunit NuoE [Phycisphaerae bacterium]NIW94189.1 NADH-quinone oxidoreductase subunit NuoE [Phycisphaerae bacterium]